MKENNKCFNIVLLLILSNHKQTSIQGNLICTIRYVKIYIVGQAGSEVIILLVMIGNSKEIGQIDFDPSAPKLEYLQNDSNIFSLVVCLLHSLDQGKLFLERIFKDTLNNNGYVKI